MDVKQPENLIIYIRQQLTDNYPAEEAMAIAREVAQRCFGITMTQAYAGTARELTHAEKSRLQQILQRLRHNEPLQYVTGQADFLSHTFNVAPGVLIPRPETEELVKLVLRDYSRSATASIIDVGTGSGCIAISIQLALPQAHVVGLDISQEALRQAKINALKLHAAVEWLQADILKSEKLPLFSADAIVSNPPYVRESEKQAIESNVKDFEPAMALFVPDNDPLIFYRALATWGKRILKPNGKIYAEINSSLATDTVNLFKEEGFRQVDLLRDQFEKDRMIICRK